MWDEIPNSTVRQFSGTFRYEHEIKRYYDVEIKNHCTKLIVICDNVLATPLLYSYFYSLWW